jgi:fatty acid-binding protein DegV
MNKKVIVSADRTCDLSQELLDRYDIKTCPYHIVLNGKEYLDNVDITPEMIFDEYHKTGALPKRLASMPRNILNFSKTLLKIIVKSCT